MLALEPVEMTMPAAAATIVTRRQVFCLALLIAVNCLLLGLAEWSLSLCLAFDGTTWTAFGILFLYELCDGIMSAQFLLLGLWCALAPERLVVRLLAGILLGGLLLGTYTLFFWMMMSDKQVLNDPLNEAAKSCGQALIAFLLLRALRPWCGWRLAWDGAPRIPASRQFRILDLMAWTAAVAIPLGLLQTLYGSQASGPAINAVAIFVINLPVTFLVFRWGIHPARKTRWLLGLLLWASLWSACLLLLLNGYVYLMDGTGGLPFGNWYSSLMMFVMWATYYLPLVLVFAGNVLALGEIGLSQAAKSPSINP